MRPLVCQENFSFIDRKFPASEEPAQTILQRIDQRMCQCKRQDI